MSSAAAFVSKAKECVITKFIPHSNDCDEGSLLIEISIIKTCGNRKRVPLCELSVKRYIPDRSLVAPTSIFRGRYSACP